MCWEWRIDCRMYLLGLIYLGFNRMVGSSFLYLLKVLAYLGYGGGSYYIFWKNFCCCSSSAIILEAAVFKFLYLTLKYLGLLCAAGSSYFFCNFSTSLLLIYFWSWIWFDNFLKASSSSNLFSGSVKSPDLFYWCCYFSFGGNEFLRLYNFLSWMKSM